MNGFYDENPKNNKSRRDNSHGILIKQIDGFCILYYASHHGRDSVVILWQLSEVYRFCIRFCVSL